MLPEGVIFDLDDTIISLKLTADDTWKVICNEYCDVNKNVDSMELYETITKVRTAYWQDLASNERGRKDQKQARREIIATVFEKLGLLEVDINVIADAFSVRRLDTLKLFDMVTETLEFLREKNVKLALITNGEAEIQRYKINKFELQKYFNIILIETEIGYGKPDERIFKRAMKELDLKPNQLWSIGDNLIWDVEAPQKLGIYSIWNDFEKKGLPNEESIKPDRIVNGICDIIE